MTQAPITDFHAHFFARPFFDALAAQSPQPGTPDERLARAAERAGIELPPADLDAHLARWMADLDTHGVQRMAAFASAPEEIPAVAEAAERSNGRLIPIAVCNPVSPGAGGKVANLLGSRGFRGVLMFPAMHHYHLDDEAAAATFQALEAERAVVYVHCGILIVKLRDLLGLPRPYDLRYANPLEVIPVANRYPGITFCIPHFGAGFFRETLIAGAQCPNIVTDTSSTNSWIKTQPDELSLRDVYARTLDVFGPSRVLFGTDSNVFPYGWRSERHDLWRSMSDDLGLTADEQAQIFAGNADNVLLGAATTSPTA